MVAAERIRHAARERPGELELEVLELSLAPAGSDAPLVEDIRVVRRRHEVWIS